MRWLKNQIPALWRLRYQLGRRRWQDRQQGVLALLATSGNKLPVAIQLRVENNQLHASLYAAEALVDYPVEFVRKEEGKFKRVRTVRRKGDVMEELSESVYSSH